MFSSGSALPTRMSAAGPDSTRRADAQLRGREDVALRAVRVVEQRDPRRPVRVVLDRGDLRRHAVLPALEVDDAVAALVAAALVARRDPAVLVAAALLRERREQALLRLRLRDLLERRDGHEAAAGARRLVAADRHYSCAPSKISILSPALSSTMAFFQPGRVPLISPRRFGFGRHLDDVHADDLDVEELLDGLADLRLVRVLVHLERVAVLDDLVVALLADDGRDQDLAGMEAHDAALPCTSGSAASLTTSERAQTTCATSSSAGTVTSTRGRLRNDLISVSSSSVATTTVGVVLAPALQELDGLLRRRRLEGVAGDRDRACPPDAWSLSAARSAARAAFLLTLTREVARASAGRRRRRPRTAARGSCPGGRGRCPSGATASSGRRRRARGSSRRACPGGARSARRARPRARGAA